MNHFFYKSHINPNCHHWAPEWLTGSGKGCTPRYLGAPVKFFDPRSCSIRKGCDRDDVEEEEEKNGKNSNSRMLLAVKRLNGDRLQSQCLCQNFVKKMHSFLNLNKNNLGQAGAELCQAQHSLSFALDTN